MTGPERARGETALRRGAPLAVVTRRDRRSGLARAESVHAGHLVVVGDGVEPLVAVGEPDAVVFARSVAKPVQAAASLELAGAAAAPLRPEEIAVAWASHRGEPAQLDAVRRLLARSSTPPEALTCPPARPDADPAAGQARLHHNCSGKHALFALAGEVRSVPRAELLDPEGPLQRHVLRLLAAIFGPAVAVGVDGCGAPAVAVPLVRLARGYRRILHDERFERVRGAGLAHPGLVGGRGRIESVLLDNGAIAKVGAEGSYAAAWQTGARTLGVAVKASDGNPRGAAVVLWHLATRLGVAPPDAWRPDPPLGGGEVVGSVLPASGIDEAALRLEKALR